MIGKTQELECDRDDDNANQGQERQHNAPASEGECLQRQCHEAALFLFLVDDVEGIEDRLGAGVGAPQRQSQGGEESRSKRALPLRSNALHLFANDLQSALRQEAGKQSQMLVDDRSVGEQAVERHQRRRGREQRQQGVVGDACRNQHHTVLLDALDHAPDDIQQTLRRYLRRLVGGASSVVLPRHSLSALAGLPRPVTLLVREGAADADQRCRDDQPAR